MQIAAGAAAADWSIGCTLVSLGPSPLHNGWILTYLSGNILQMFRFFVLIFLSVFVNLGTFFTVLAVSSDFTSSFFFLHFQMLTLLSFSISEFFTINGDICHVLKQN